MWRYRCPICKKMVENPNMGREDVKRIATKSIYCPHCNGRLYVEESGATVDLAGALVNFSLNKLVELQFLVRRRLPIIMRILMKMS